jgi:phosphoenolpyruvate carboxykinase (GTP)
MRVLDWIIDRCEGKVDAVESPIGFLPKAEDINVEGLESVTLDTIKELLTVDVENWKKEAEGIEGFYGELTRVPEELKAELANLKANLNK